MTAEPAEALDPRDAEPPITGRRRPLGLVVVMVLAVGRLIIELVELVTVQPSGFWQWVASGSNVPQFDVGSPGWYLGRLALIGIVVLTAASIIGLWRFKTWGWSLALIIAGIILALDLGWWMAGQPRYPGMFLNMVAVFYLNQRDVRAIFLPGSL